MLNKLPHPLLLLANQIVWSRLLIQICILNDKQCRSRSVGFFRSQLIWIYTVCKGRVYLGSTGQALMYFINCKGPEQAHIHAVWLELLFFSAFVAVDKEKSLILSKKKQKKTKKNLGCRYWLRMPWQGAINECPQSMFLWRNTSVCKKCFFRS